MHRVILRFVLVFACLLTGCIERYYPEEDDLKTGTMVINAHFTDQPGEQLMEISRSVGLTNPSFDPVSGSFAELIREDGEFREFGETKPGYYGSYLDVDFLQTGMSFKVHVIAPDGKEYESDFDMLRPVPKIDSIYYLVEHNSFAEEADSVGGVRFYIDFTYDDEAYEYIRWELTETYEFHNPDMEAFVSIPGQGLQVLPDTSNYRVCYITNELYAIHSMSTGLSRFWDLC